MRTPKIYIETSVFNHAVSDQSPEKRKDTLKLFEEIRNGKFIPYTSDYVRDEVRKASHEKRRELREFIREQDIELLQKTDEIERLADEYIKENIIPEKYRTDALHIATATVNNIDIVVSWNFKHIVKRNTMIMTKLVNKRNGYNEVEIYSPPEVTEDGV